MSSEARSSRHEEIHLPPPSIAPVLVALGALLLVIGFLLWPMLPVGLIVLLFGLWKFSRAPEMSLERPSMGVNSRLLGMWVFLASEIMFFSGLIATFLGYRNRADTDVHALLNVPLMTIGTFVLLSSSFTAVMALSAIQRGKLKALRNRLLMTMGLGAAFLLIELLEWAELAGHGITTGTLYGSAFFTTTGFHGMHVIIGLVWMAFLLFRTLRADAAAGGDSRLARFFRRFTRQETTALDRPNPDGLELFGLYWHFVDIVWIILFTVIYLMV